MTTIFKLDHVVSIIVLISASIYSTLMVEVVVAYQAFYYHHHSYDYCKLWL